MASRKFDDRTEKNLATLLPTAQAQFRVFIAACQDAGIDWRLIGGTRTPAEQNALFEQGRTKPGDVVTNARAWFGNHNFAISVKNFNFARNVTRRAVGFDGTN